MKKKTLAKIYIKQKEQKMENKSDIRKLTSPLWLTIIFSIDHKLSYKVKTWFSIHEINVGNVSFVE